MIYTVELNFSEPDREAEWHTWYESYLKKLVSLDGWRFLALYSLDSLDVYASEAYRNIGGGGNASVAYKEAISRRRNVYEGVKRFPEVAEKGRVLLCEDAPDGFDLPNVLFLPLSAASGRQKAGATALDGEPERRALALTDADTVNTLNLTAIEGLAVYAPITKRYS